MSINYLKKLSQEKLLSLYTQMGFLYFPNTVNESAGTAVDYSDNFITITSWDHTSKDIANHIEGSVSFNDFMVFDAPATVQNKFELAMIGMVSAEEYHQYEEDKLNHITNQIYEAYNGNGDTIRKIQEKNRELLSRIKIEQEKSHKRIAIKDGMEHDAAMKKRPK